MNVAGLIFSNIHDQNIPEMTRRRTMASIPFGCRYRLVDFALSNMVNSNITDVGVITHFNYQSLTDHIGNGKDWDLARRSGGIKILPPFSTAYENPAASKLYSSRLEAIMSAQNFIERSHAEYFVLSDCDVVLNIDLTDVVENHIRSGATVTIVTKDVDVSADPYEKQTDLVKVGEDGFVTECRLVCSNLKNITVNTNIMVMRKSDLQMMIEESLSKGYSSFSHDILPDLIAKKKLFAYRFAGFYARIGTLESYFANSMALLNEEIREDLFENSDRRILTKIRNSAPTKYAESANVKNSLIADGCVIEGTVENSILFRGVKIGKGTVVRNSILLQDSFIGANVQLNCVITDKNAIIKEGRLLSGHETMPFFIGKGMTV